MQAQRQLLTVLGASGGVALMSLNESDWRNVVELARRQGLLPMMQCSGAVSVLMPSWCRDSVRAAYLVNTVRNRQIYTDLGRLLEAFHGRGVPVILLKGVHLAARIFPDAGLRSMVDIDLLVPDRSVGAAAAALQALGYRGGVAECGVDTWMARGAPRHPLEFTHERSPNVKIHLSIAASGGPFQIDPEELWQRSMVAEVAGQPAGVLCPEHLLIHLCIHTAAHAVRNHGFQVAPFAQGLRPLLDIQAVVARKGEGIDWKLLASVARRWRAQRCVRIGLGLAKRLCGAAVPSDVFEQLEPDLPSGHAIDIPSRQLALGGWDPAIPWELRGTLSRLVEMAWEMGRRPVREWPGRIAREIWVDRGSLERYIARVHADLPKGRARRYAWLICARDRVRRLLQLVGLLFSDGVGLLTYARCCREQRALWHWLTSPAPASSAGLSDPPPSHHG